MSSPERSPVSAKLSRISRGGAPRVLDLFAGCGGLSLGFQAAGCQAVGAIEIDPIAARTYARNFHPDDHGGAERHATARDIREIAGSDLARELKLGPTALAVDFVIGGPPCQAYARIGRAKLREVAAHPEAFRHDLRSNLYLRYLKFVRSLKPIAVLMENVPDALNHGGHNVAEEVAEALSELGYRCGYTMLNSVNYGVPQMRERMFLLGYHHEVGAEVRFPFPTHWVSLPRGYESSRRVALQTLQEGLFDQATFYIPTPQPSRDLPPAVTAKDALRDLPPITLHLEGKLPRGTRRFDQLSRYLDIEPSRYARLMRMWPGFESGEGVSDHVIRSLPRDYDIFRRMAPGDQYPEAHAHARAIFRQRLRAAQRKGFSVAPGTKIYRDIWKATVPPYDSKKFPNKWRKMEPDAPARTLMAHLGKDSYSHIHYDSTQARTISVREAARLQSFPDGFLFEGTMNPAFRQIGNAVPPILAWRIAEELMRAVRAETKERKGERPFLEVMVGCG